MSTETIYNIAETTDGIRGRGSGGRWRLTLRAGDGSDTGASRTLGAGRPKRKDGT